MQLLSLRAGDWRLSVCPELGGCISGLWYQGQPVLRSVSEAAPSGVRASSGFVLLPYSNRVGLGQLRWRGLNHQLRPNFAPEPHAIHGVGWQRHWRIASADLSEVCLTLAHSADADWPFAFSAQQRLRLTEEGLSLELSLESQAQHDFPVGLGWHPYFVKPGNSALTFKARGRWSMGADKLPVELEPSAGLSGSCDDLAIDHCFEGWEHLVRLHRDGLGFELACQDVDRLVVFTRPELDFIAIEPVSHVNNALQLAADLGVEPADLGVRSLAPGQEMTLRFHVRVSRQLQAQ